MSYRKDYSDEIEQGLRIEKLRNEIELQKITLAAQKKAMATQGVVGDKVFDDEADDWDTPRRGDSI